MHPCEPEPPVSPTLQLGAPPDESAPGGAVCSSRAPPEVKPTPRVVDPSTLAALYVGPSQLLALIDNTSAVIYMRSVDGRYMLINRKYEQLFDLRRDEIIGLTDHDLFPAEVADHFRANDQQAVAAGRPIEVEETAPGPDGMSTYVTLKFPLLDHADKPYAICGISTDITERKRAEAAASALNAELEQQVRELRAQAERMTRTIEELSRQRDLPPT